MSSLLIATLCWAIPSVLAILLMNENCKECENELKTTTFFVLLGFSIFGAGIVGPVESTEAMVEHEIVEEDFFDKYPNDETIYITKQGAVFTGFYWAFGLSFVVLSAIAGDALHEFNMRVEHHRKT